MADSIKMRTWHDIAQHKVLPTMALKRERVPQQISGATTRIFGPSTANPDTMAVQDRHYVLYGDGDGTTQIRLPGARLRRWGKTENISDALRSDDEVLSPDCGKTIGIKLSREVVLTHYGQVSIASQG